MKTAIVIPAMRKSVVAVIDDLNKQTVKPDFLWIVNNGKNKFEYLNSSFPIRVDNPKENIGTNRAWNLVFDDTLKDFDYIGICGDDYILHERCLEVLIEALNINWAPHKIGMSTAIIYNRHDRYYTSYDFFKNQKDIVISPVAGKGNMGFCLMKKCFLDCLPEIPEEFKIFFGDTWFGYWVEKLGFKILRVSCSVAHNRSDDLKMLLDYLIVLKNERKIWFGWLNGDIEL